MTSNWPINKTCAQPTTLPLDLHFGKTVPEQRAGQETQTILVIYYPDDIVQFCKCNLLFIWLCSRTITGFQSCIDTFSRDSPTDYGNYISTSPPLSFFTSVHLWKAKCSSVQTWLIDQSICGLSDWKQFRPNLFLVAGKLNV